MRFKEFNTAWIHSKIGEICEIEMCKRIFSNQTNTIGGVPFYKIGTIGGKPDTWISENLFNEYKDKYNYPKKGEILITCSGTVGKCIIFNGEDAYFQDSNIVWLANKSTVLNIFLFYIMNNIDWSYLNSTTITRIYGSDLRNLDFYYPNNKNEQQKVTEFLSLIDKRIDTQSKIIEDLELFEKEINNTIINKLVEYKDLVKFSSIYNFAKEGGTPNTSHPEYYTKGSIPFVKIDDLTTKYLVSNQSFITKLGLKNSSAWLIPANSLLYSNGATIGAISINKYPVTTKQGILGIVPKSDYLSEYLYYFLRSNYFKKEICKITTQGTMKSAYIKDIDNILVPRINKNQQNEILTLLSEITFKIQKEKDMLELYKKQKAYLLKNMFI